MKRAPRLPLAAVEHEKARAILDAAWPVVHAQHPDLAMTSTGWRQRNKSAALELVGTGYSPEAVVGLLTTCYTHPRLQRYYGAVVMLNKLIEHTARLVEAQRERRAVAVIDAPSDPNIVPFGKHLGQPMGVLLADKDYCQHMIAQPGFRERYRDVFNIIVNNGIAPSATPEHNAMQAAYLDDDWCLRVARALGLRGTVVEDRKFEYKSCWDVRFVVRGDDIGHTTVLLELKPDLGDDYPVVLRQVQRYPNGARCVRAVIVQRYGFESVTWAQVVAIFAASNITLLVEPHAP